MGDARNFISIKITGFEKGLPVLPEDDVNSLFLNGTYHFFYLIFLYLCTIFENVTILYHYFRSFWRYIDLKYIKQSENRRPFTSHS